MAKKTSDERPARPETRRRPAPTTKAKPAATVSPPAPEPDAKSASFVAPPVRPFWATTISHNGNRTTLFIEAVGPIEAACMMGSQWTGSIDAIEVHKQGIITADKEAIYRIDDQPRTDFSVATYTRNPPA